MTYKTFLSATWCFHKYQVHTLEVPNAFLHPKRWDRVTLTKEYTHNEHHCLKQLLLQTYIQVQKLGRKVGLCIDKVASKGPIVVTKSDATRRDHNLLLFKLNSQFHTIRIPLLPFTNQKPHHRGNRQDWIASKNTYPLTSPKWEYPQATFKQHWCAQLIDLNLFIYLFIFWWCTLHYNQKVAPLIGITRAKRLQGISWKSKRVASRGVENEGESGGTTHPTQTKGRFTP